MIDVALANLLGPSTMTVRPWRDPVVERVGHDACGDYVELFWLGSLGPTATWLLRRLAVLVVTEPDGCLLHLPDLAGGLGLGRDTGPGSAVGKSLGRLQMFGLVRAENSHLAARAVVPPLPHKQLARLPEHLREAHTLWSDDHPHPALARAYGGVS